jgi:hypothetical protein
MPKTKTNPFATRKVVTVAGFELSSYDSLLARERLKLLEVRRDIFNGVSALLKLAGDVAADLDVSEKEAWIILQNQGVGSDGTDHKLTIAPYFARLKSLNDSNAQNETYMRASVAVILASRITGKWLSDALPMMQDAFPGCLSQDDAAIISDVDLCDRLDDDRVMAAVEGLVMALPFTTFDELLTFITTEENGGVPVEQGDESEQEAEDENPKL